MGTFDRFKDSPNQIKIEGQEISLKFVRNGDGTATISWNIPAPAAGCAADQGAYDGIVITVDFAPPNYISTSPKDGTFYNYDTTVDKDLHAGDKIDTALVVGAFYNDKTTNKITVTGILPKTPYYFSGYAVDNVGRYHREGVHAFSLPTGPQELNKSTSDIPAYHDIFIDVLGGINVNKNTGLDATKIYDFKIQINGNEYNLKVNGSDALTFSTLIKNLNKQFALLENPIQLPDYPNKNAYYWDSVNSKLFLWDGLTNNSVSCLISYNDPSIPIIGTFWYNGTILKVYGTAGWQTHSFIELATNPIDLECGTLWYDGTDVWEWDSNRWCKLCLYVQTRNPSLPPIINCDTFWFDSINKLLYSYNTKQKKWDEVLAIISPIDPNTLNTGDFWFNETSNKVHQFVGGTWNILQNTRYEERNESGELDNPVGGGYWFIPSETKLFKRDLLNTQWIEQALAIYPTDPRNRKSCDLWWNDSQTTPQLLGWDSKNSIWKPVTYFFISNIDPASAPNLPDCAVWLNPNTMILKKINKSSCENVEYISSIYDPTIPSSYGIWHDTKNDKWYEWDGGDWIEIDIILSQLDPFYVDINTLWFNLGNNTLNKWNGLSWDNINYSSVPLNPIVGELWFNTVTETLYRWTGLLWETYSGPAIVDFRKSVVKDINSNRDYIHFYTRESGCATSIEVFSILNGIFTSIKDPIIYGDPVLGASGLDAGPMYKQLGVGDDGSPDERRALHDAIRLNLGYTVVQVELTKEQIDECINNALLMLRKRSSFSYKRGMFFMDLKPNQQTYILTNKCAGFNKIVGVNTIYRMSSAFFRTTYAGNDAFGIAALQQLYTIGAFDMLSYHMVSSYIEELEKLFASKITFQWIEKSRELKLYQHFFASERVLLDVFIERTEQDLLTDRETSLWIKNWAIANAKLILSQSRGKFQQLPGPNGSTALNTQDLISQAQSEMEALKQELDDFVMNDIVDAGLASHFVLG